MKSGVTSEKVLLLGDSGVGKTGLIMRYCDNTFPVSFSSTIGVDIKMKLIVNKRGERIKLQIWDTAGQERFKTITSNVYRGVHGLLLVYDVTDEVSFEHVTSWIEHVHKMTQDDDSIVLILLGNKCDDETRRCISAEKGQQLADQHKIKFFETSGKEGINVQTAFETLADDILHQIKIKRTSTGDTDLSQGASIETTTKLNDSNGIHSSSSSCSC